MMKKHSRTIRRVGLMAGTSLLALAAIGPAASPALAKPSGSIWTTGEDCSNPAPQNDNSYLVGETIYVRGSNFAASSAFTWSITGKPGGASEDPNDVVAAGDGSTDANGAFCLEAYEVAEDDGGEYSVSIDLGSTHKNDNYRVEPGETPELEDGDDPSDPPADEETTPPSDENTPADEETPADETPADETPADEETPANEETTPPSDDQTVDEIVDTNTPADNETPSDVSAGNGGSNDNYSQEVLGVVSDGPVITPPPSDTIAAPSDQGSGTDWRMIVAFLGFLILAATIGLPERRRAV